MKILSLLPVAGVFALGLGLFSCSEDEPQQVYPQPATLNEEGNYTITRFETSFTHEGNPVGTPKSENPFPNHIITLAGPTHYKEEINGTPKNSTTGSYLVNANAKTLQLTINQPLAISSGTYQIDSLTDKRLVMHIETENTTTKVVKTFTIRANR